MAPDRTPPAGPAYDPTDIPVADTEDLEFRVELTKARRELAEQGVDHAAVMISAVIELAARHRLAGNEALVRITLARVAAIEAARDELRGGDDVEFEADEDDRSPHDR